MTPIKGIRNVIDKVIDNGHVDNLLACMSSRSGSRESRRVVAHTIFLRVRVMSTAGRYR